MNWHLGKEYKYIWECSLVACYVNRARGSFPSVPGPSPARPSALGGVGLGCWSGDAQPPTHPLGVMAAIPCHLHPLFLSNLPPKWHGTSSVVCRVLWHSSRPSPSSGGRRKHWTMWKLKAAGVAELFLNWDIGSPGSYHFSTCFATAGLQAGGIQ